MYIQYDTWAGRWGEIHILANPKSHIGFHAPGRICVVLYCIIRVALGLRFADESAVPLDVASRHLCVPFLPGPFGASGQTNSCRAARIDGTSSSPWRQVAATLTQNLVGHSHDAEIIDPDLGALRTRISPSFFFNTRISHVGVLIGLPTGFYEGLQVSAPVSIATRHDAELEPRVNNSMQECGRIGMLAAWQSGRCTREICFPTT